MSLPPRGDCQKSRYRLKFVVLQYFCHFQGVFVDFDTQGVALDNVLVAPFVVRVLQVMSRVFGQVDSQLFVWLGYDELPTYVVGMG